ncbi:MAG: insulinase family protein [Cyclobacteriaceae bacterium]|nr:insulinase family protein [Cyclobacteriaceae bacterium]
MKKIFIYILALGFIGTANAQVDRSKLPVPAPAKSIQIGDYESFTLKNGMKVFVVENHKLPRVTLSLVFDHQPVMEVDNAGYVDMVGTMLRRGTTTRTKEQLDEAIDFIGASLGASATSLYASSLTKHQEKLLELMSDVLFNPTFPAEELEKIKTQTISGLAANKEDANSISGNVTTALVYGKNHPYGTLTTEETVGNIKIEDIKNYYQTYFKPNIAYLAIVGDINKKEAQKLVKKYFAKWEQGDVPSTSYEMPKAPEKTFVALVDKPSAVQSVIDITYPVELKTGTPDVIKARVLNQILGGSGSARLFTNLREDKAYTYGAYSSLSSDMLVGAFSASASVRNEVTDSAFNEFILELDKIRTEDVSEDEINLAKSSIAGSFARSLERPQTVARFAINTARYNLPEGYYANYLKNVQAVSVADIKATAQKYIHPDKAYFTVVGKASEIKDVLKAFGEVKYFDNYGVEYTPSDAPQLPAGLTAEKVIADYVKAIGGEEVISTIKSIKIVSEAEIQGQKLSFTSIKASPNKSYISILMGGAMEMQKQVFDGTNYAEYSRGSKTPDDENKAKDALVDAAFIPEMNYVDLGVKLTLKGAEKVGDKYAYSIDVVYPSGKKATNYFDMESGLKVRVANSVTTPQGEMVQNVDYQDYSAENGVLIPHLVVIPMGPMKLEAKVTSVEVNGTIDEAIFKIE